MKKNYYLYIGASLLVIILALLLFTANPPTQEQPQKENISNVSDLISTHKSKTHNSTYMIETNIQKTLGGNAEVIEKKYMHKNSKHLEKIRINGELVSETYEINGTPIRSFPEKEELEVLENYNISNINIIKKVLLNSGYRIKEEKQNSFTQNKFTEINDNYLKQELQFDEINSKRLDLNVENGIIKSLRLKVDGVYQDSNYEVIINSEHKKLEKNKINTPEWVKTINESPVLETNLKKGYLLIKHKYGPPLERIGEVRLLTSFSNRSFITKTGPKRVNLKKGGEIYINVEENNINIGDEKVEIKDRNIEITRDKPRNSTLVGDIYYFTIKNGKQNKVLEKGYTR